MAPRARAKNRDRRTTLGTWPSWTGDARGVIQRAAAAAKQPVDKWIDDAPHRAALETLRRAG